MTPELFQRARTVFLAAKRVDPASRAALIEDICDGDADLRRLVDRLLEADSESTETVLDEPVFRRPLTSSVDAVSAPRRLGSYRVVRSLGAGSVGDVHLAERDGGKASPVAIKVLRPGSFARTELAAARFEIERSALSMLAHPNIARIIDAGRTDEDRAFIVMEYVPGLPIDEYCRRHRLSRRSRLTLFLQLCDAVQHAHQRGVIHRDLKPANVLVVDEPWPMVKVVDFGIAKIMGDPGSRSGTITEQGQLLGTLAYMSPEQLDPSRGDADARSDVYALGVILYQLLTDRMPLEEDDALTRRARAALDLTSIAPMRELPGAARRDLETIVLKALQADPERRYATPMHLAEDVRRHLHGKPVQARGPSAWYRMSKVAGRHPVAFTATVVLAGAIVVLALSNMLWRYEVERERSVARGSVLHLMDNAVDQIRHVSGAAESRLKMAESLIAQTDRLLQFHPDDVELLECRARLLDELGDLALLSGDERRARSLRTEVLSLRDGLAKRAPATVDRRRRHAEAMVKLGDLHGNTGADLAAKRTLYERAMAEHLDLHKAYASHVGVIDDLCWSHERLAAIDALEGDDASAAAHRERRLALAIRLLSLSPDRALSHHNAAWAHLNIAAHSNDLDTVLDETYLALSHAREAIDREPDRAAFRETLIVSARRRADALADAGECHDARRLVLEVITETDRIASLTPDSPRLRRLRPMHRLWGAEVFARSLRPSDAGRLAAEALALLNWEASVAATSESQADPRCRAVALIDQAVSHGGLSRTASLRVLASGDLQDVPPSFSVPLDDEFLHTDELDAGR